MRSGKYRTALFLIMVLLMAGVCLYAVCMLRIYIVSEESMSPTLAPGDKILSVRINTVTRRSLAGKPVIFYFPYGTFQENIECNTDIKLIKRCVGEPGDTVLIRYDRDFMDTSGWPLTAGDVITNVGGHRCDDIFHMSPVYVPASGDTLRYSESNSGIYRRIIDYEQNSGNVSTDPTLHVFDRNYYFVVGDNHLASYDSRHWGFVPEEFIISYMLIRL